MTKQVPRKIIWRYKHIGMTKPNNSQMHRQLLGAGKRRWTKNTERKSREVG
jgi:hypothetical protein